MAAAVLKVAPSSAAVSFVCRDLHAVPQEESLDWPGQPGDHSLHMTFSQRHKYCDLCKANIPNMDTRFGCLDCDFDVCYACFMNSDDTARAAQVPTRYPRFAHPLHPKHRLFYLRDIKGSCNMCAKYSDGFQPVYKCFECNVLICQTCFAKPCDVIDEDARVNDTVEPDPAGAYDLGAVQVGHKTRQGVSRPEFSCNASAYSYLQ